VTGDPIRANRGNIALYWLFFNHITTILVQIRQTGKSLAPDVLYTWLGNIGASGTEINIVTKDETLRATNFTRLKDIESELPFYLKRRGKTEVANSEEIKISKLRNLIRGHLSNTSPKMALKVGRGITSTIFGFDEASYIPNIEIALPAALAAGSAARDIARNTGQPFGTLITTTAGMKDDRDGRYVFRLLSESAVWTEEFFNARNLAHLETMIRSNSRSEINGVTGKKQSALRVNCTFSHRQLGLTDEWLRRTIEESEATGDDARRDFLNHWTSGSLTSPFTTSITAIIRDSEKPVLHAEISEIQNFITRWYIPEDQIERRMRSSFFTIGLDTSDAAGNDDIALVLRDIKTGEVVAAGNYNESNLIHFCDWLVLWFTRFDNTLLIIERRSSAIAMVDYLIIKLLSLGIDPFKRIYNRVVQDKEENFERYREICKPLHARDPGIYSKYKSTFGFATAGAGYANRAELYGSTMQNLAKYTGDSVNDKTVIDQMLSLVIKNGRMDHEIGGHDDSVIAWLLSGWILLLGKNLDFYGINNRIVLSECKRNQEDNSPEKLYQRKEQAELRDDIQVVVEKLKSEKDLYALQRLEHQLRILSNKLILDNTEKFSVDAVLDEIRNTRAAPATTVFNRFGSGYKASNPLSVTYGAGARIKSSWER